MDLCSGSKPSLKHPPQEYYRGTVRLVYVDSVLLEDGRQNSEEDMGIPPCYDKACYEMHGVLCIQPPSGRYLGSLFHHQGFYRFFGDDSLFNQYSNSVPVSKEIF